MFVKILFILLCVKSLVFCSIADDEIESGNSLEIGKKYLHSKKDLDKATFYFKQASLEGNAEASRYLADIYLYRLSKKGPNIQRFYQKISPKKKAKNPSEAFAMQANLQELYIKAVTKMDEKAAYLIGLMFMGGTFEIDKEEALEWFELAHILGHPKAKTFIDILNSKWTDNGIEILIY